MSLLSLLMGDGGFDPSDLAQSFAEDTYDTPNFWDSFSRVLPQTQVMSAYPDSQFYTDPAPSGGGFSYSPGFNAEDQLPFSYAPRAAEPSIWDRLSGYAETLDKASSSPLAKLGIRIAGPLTAAYGAKKQNDLYKQAAANRLAQRLAEKAQYAAETAPIRVTNNKVDMPSWGATQRNAFANNSLSGMTPRSTGTMYAANGGSVQYFEDGGQPKPSLGGFLRYLANGRQIPDTPEEKREKESAVIRVRADQRESNRMNPEDREALNELFNEENHRAKGMASGGIPHYVSGGTSGQSDKVPAMLSDGEFVMDADTVSALGDGNNAAGAGALEQMRQNVRKHKRKAPINKIPPKAKKPEQYLKGAK